MIESRYLTTPKQPKHFVTATPPLLNLQTTTIESPHHHY